jgi:hypothetical protein
LKGDKKYFIENNLFYKEYTDKEYSFLKALHGDNLYIDTAIINDIKYIVMPEGHVISIDTIPLKQRQNSEGIRHIITSNMSNILEQVNRLNNLGIYYTDCMQWLYYDNKMYLIDFDFSFNQTIDYEHNNFTLLINFLSAFNIDSKFISNSIRYLDLFQTEAENYIFLPELTELYNKLHNDTMQYNHVYYCRNERHIQCKEKSICIYTDDGNVLLTEDDLNNNIINEWELIKIA